MTIEHGYADEAQLRTHFGDEGTVLTQELVERAVESASRAVDLFCGSPSRRFWLDGSAVTRRYRPTDPYEVYVDDIGSTSGLEVKIDTTGSGTFDTTLVEGTDYELHPLDADQQGLAAYAWTSIMLYGDGYAFLTGTRRPSVQVTAKFGWAAVPKAIEEGTLLKAANLFKRKEAPFGVAGFGELGVVRIGRNDPDVIDLIERFVRINGSDT